MDKDSLKKIISHSKEYGFIFPSSEIYEGLNAIYDYACLLYTSPSPRDS